MNKPWSIRDRIVITISFLLAFILTIIPLPAVVMWFRPAWAMLVLVYWLIKVPHRFGLMGAWFVGLAMDLLTGTLLGVHALVFTLIAFFILKFHLMVRGFSTGQKLLSILLLQILYLFVQHWIMGLNHVSSYAWQYWMPAMTTTLCWPMVALLLRDYQNFFKMR